MSVLNGRCLIVASIVDVRLSLGSRNVPDLRWQLLISHNRDSQLTQPQLRVRVTLRLAVYRQSFRLDDKPLENHDQIFFSDEYLLF
jgi:hypothetical protein